MQRYEYNALLKAKQFGGVKPADMIGEQGTQSSSLPFRPDSAPFMPPGKRTVANSALFRALGDRALPQAPAVL
jgi:hypothetical protein